MLIEGMGGDFADDVGVALRRKLFEIFLDVFGVRRGGVSSG